MGRNIEGCEVFLEDKGALALDREKSATRMAIGECTPSLCTDYSFHEFSSNNADPIIKNPKSHLVLKFDGPFPPIFNCASLHTPNRVFRFFGVRPTCELTGKVCPVVGQVSSLVRDLIKEKNSNRV